MLSQQSISIDGKNVKSDTHKSVLAQAIQNGQYRDGLASIMGQHPTGIDRVRKLILELEQLESTDVAKLLAWCSEPMAELPFIPEHRGVLEDLAQHEFGHLGKR